MAQSSLARLEQARARESEQMLWTRVCSAPTAPRLKLSPEGFDIIAECKLASPSAGDLSQHTTDIDRRVQAYAHGGACAVSVLTEPTRFAGSLEHLAQTARTLAALGVPVMRKDFLVDPYQVMEARAAGAGGVLVIVRMLDRSRIKALLDVAAMLKMFVVIEAFDAVGPTYYHPGVTEPENDSSGPVPGGDPTAPCNWNPARSICPAVTEAASCPKACPASSPSIRLTNTTSASLSVPCSANTGSSRLPPPRTAPLSSSFAPA